LAKIPLVKVRYADSFAQVLNQIGAPTERLLNQLNISVEILSVPGGFMTVEKLWEVSALAATYSGVPDIGLRAGLTPLVQHGRFGNSILSAPTLHKAITRFCIEARAEMTHANFHIYRHPDCVWLCGGFVEGTEDEVRQVELYRIALFVQIVRLAIGIAWKPRKIRLQSHDGRHLQGTALLKDSNIDFGCEQPAVAIPYRWLSLPLNHAAKLNEDRETELNLFPNFKSSPDFENAAKEIIRTHIFAGRSKISDISRSLDVPVRTLQTHLSGSGLTFSQLLDQVRIETAMVLLEDADVKISDVALEIGYRNSTHFSRAFRRNTGVTPQQYRTARRSGL